jgi:opacity protein-like surface antigen
MKKLLVALIASAAAMGAVHAEGTPYVGVGVASADHNYSIAGASNTSGTGYKASAKVFGGYDFDQTFGVEAGYTDFRKSSTNYTVNNVAGRTESSGDAFYVAGKASAALNEQVSLFGKLGVTRVKNDISSTTASLSGSDNKTGLYAGVGVQYKLSKQVALTAEYERYGKSTKMGAKPDVFTVAAKYAF